MEIKARLGHKDIKTTLNTYGHLMPTLGERLDEALNDTHQAAKLELPRPHRGLAVVGLDNAGACNPV